jgi:hypothetical protein
LGSLLLPAPTGHSWPAGIDMAASAQARLTSSRDTPARF